MYYMNLRFRHTGFELRARCQDYASATFCGIYSGGLRSRPDSRIGEALDM